MRRVVALCAAALVSFAAFAQPKPIVVGGALAQTGYLADLSIGTRNALLLWQEQLNAAGGLLGRPVELRLPDDESDARRSTALYETLIKEGADLLIGAFGSAATSMSAAVAERNRRVMVNATGVSPAIHRRVYQNVFQVPPPSDTTAAGILPLAARAGAKSLLVTARDEGAASSLLEQLARGAQKAGVTLKPPAYYVMDSMRGLTPFAKTVQAGGADAVVTPAGARDSAELVRGFRVAGYRPRLFVAKGALEPDFIKLVGMDAEYTMALSSYETRAATPGNAGFVKAYRDKYSRAPDFHAACGWATGKVIEAAVARAGSLDQEKLRAALASVEVPTVLGGYKVAADGGQLAATSFVVQILKGRREVVWPDAFKSAEAVVPMPEWAPRKR